MKPDLRIVDADERVPTSDQLMAASFIALGESIIAGKIKLEQALLVAVVDGSVTYTPFGHVSIVEGVGLLELASRKIERDARER